jgi:hypothetical protein
MTRKCTRFPDTITTAWNRGDYREVSFLGHFSEGQLFLKTLEQTCQRTAWQVQLLPHV